MKTRWSHVFLLALCLPAGSLFPTEIPAKPLPSQSAPAAAPEGSRHPDCASREAAARDLESFQGGRQVIIATEYDVQILVGILLIAAIVLIIILI